MPERKSWRLIVRRGISNADGHLKPHAPSRHQVNESGLVHPSSGFLFGQGTLFPNHVQAGDITHIERTVQHEWDMFQDKRKSAVHDVRDAGGAKRISVRLDKFGVRTVGAFVRNGQVVTVFPEESNGSTLIKRHDQVMKKSK